jgi:multiple sugar transport system substrate-binding protein
MANYANGVLPTRTSALAALNEEGKLHSGQVLVDQSKVVEPLFAQGTPTWYPQFSTAVNTAINGVAKGQITVDQAVKNIADAAEMAKAQ